MTAPPTLPPLMTSSFRPPTPPSSSPRPTPPPTKDAGVSRPNGAAPSPPASPKRTPSSIGNGTPNGTGARAMPAPIGIPARGRANTTSGRPSFLSSSPTNVPFMVSTFDTASLLAEPPSSIFSSSVGGSRPRVAARSVSTGGMMNGQRTGTPRSAVAKGPPTPVPPPASPKALNGKPLPSSSQAGTSPKASAPVSPKAKASPSSPKVSKPSPPTPTADIGDINFLLANNSCLAEALANGDYDAASKAPATKPAPKQRRASSTSKGKSGWRARLFDFDNVLGALDPSRMAEASAPEPVQTVVFGAETETGLVVCRALLAARHYALVALMVDTSTPATAELEEKGVRVVQVDMDNPATYQAELKGAQAVYLSSNVIALHSILQQQPEPQRTEIARRADRTQLCKAVHACARAKVGHLIFRVNACGHEIVENSIGQKTVVNSSTPDDLKRLGVPHTILHTSVPYTRVYEWLQDGKKGLILNLPVPDDTGIPWFAIEQTGDYVLAALRNPTKWIGRDMHAISDSYTPKSMAAQLSKLARRPVDTMHITRKEFDSLESHERLTLKWDAWNKLVRNEYNYEHEIKAIQLDVTNQWKLGDWIAQNREIQQRLKF